MSTSTAVTWLFVPGNRAERFAKAAAAGADEIILDLEDAVSPSQKDEARTAVTEWLASGNGWVRINPPEADEHAADLDSIASQPGLRGVIVPKAEDPADLERIGARVGGGVGVIALIESALGMHNAVEIARSPAVVRLAFGSIDYALDLDCDESDDTLLLARSTLVLASRLGDIAAPIDGVTVETRDADVIGGAARGARGLGFGGKLCIHPAQLTAVAAAFTPTDEELAWAGRVLDAASDDDAGAASVDGKMIDKPVLERARRLTARAKR